MRTTSRRPKGFSLLELMVVVAIIALLASIAVPNFGRGRKRAKEESLRTSLQLTRAALNTFYADSGCFPLSLSDLDETGPPTNCLTVDGSTTQPYPSGRYRGPYLIALEKDPISGLDFTYASTGSPPPFTVKSSAPGSDSGGTAYSSY